MWINILFRILPLLLATIPLLSLIHPPPYDPPSPSQIEYIDLTSIPPQNVEYIDLATIPIEIIMDEEGVEVVAIED